MKRPPRFDRGGLIFSMQSGALVERSSNHFDFEALNFIAFANIFILLEGHSAFHAIGDLWHFVFEAFQGLQHAFMVNDIVS